MTVDEFNDLPLTARQYIEKQQGCQSCGKSRDIDTLYKNYLIMSKKALFTLRVGAVSYLEDGIGKILYPIQPTDTQDQIRGKLTEALKVYAVAPSKFADIQEEKIEKILAEGTADAADAADATDAADAADAAGPILDHTPTPEKQLFGAAKKAAETKATKDSLD